MRKLLWNTNWNIYLAQVSDVTDDKVTEKKSCFLTLYIEDVMHRSMLRVSTRGGGGGEDPGHMWGIWLFRRIFGQNPHCGAPKLGQIRSNIPRCSINLYWKWVVRSYCSVFVQNNIKTSFYFYLKQRSFRALLKLWKPRYFNFKMVGAAVVRFVSGWCHFRDTLNFSAKENRKLCK